MIDDQVRELDARVAKLERMLYLLIGLQAPQVLTFLVSNGMI